MAMTLRPRSPDFVAEIEGLDLSQNVDDAIVGALWDAIHRYAVLVFHDQKMTDAQLRDFAAKFGPLEIGRTAARGGKRRLEIPQIGDISNLDINSQVRALTDRQRLDSLGNRLWHADASYMEVPVALGMLHGVKIPPPSPFGAGETEFADCRAAYDDLDATTKDAIENLVAMHDIFYSRGQIGFTEFPQGEREQYPPHPQRLVRYYPGSKRKSLFLSAHASHIRDWPLPDGRLLLMDLNTHATQPKYVYSHKWREGDFVIWDNRCTLHRGRPHDETAPRDLRRATVLELASSMEQAA